MRLRRPALGLAVEAALVASVSLLCAAWALALWRADLTLPLRYTATDDAKFYLMLVKGIVTHGSYLSNSSLGVPFGQHLYDLPQGADDLNLLMLRGLALFSSNPVVIVNAFFLLTFALTSLVCHLVLRNLGLSAPAAGVSAVLFSLLTYHFFRGESHLFLSAYYAVPLAGYLFLDLLAGDPLFTRRPLATIGLCVVIGSDNLYYAAFALVLLVAATTIAAVRRDRAGMGAGLAIMAVITITLAVNLAPSIVYRIDHGANVAVERSAAADANNHEAFALSPANLVVPAPGNRIAPLRQLAASYDSAVAPRYCESCFGSLGTVGTIGFGWLAVCAVAAMLGAGGVATRRLLTHASLGVAIALAVGAVGGLGSLVEVFLTPDIRAWNRISVLIAFFSLLAAGLLLDLLLGAVRRRRGGTALAASILAAMLAFGVYDQTTPAFVPPYAAIERQWHSDATFVAELEARLPRAAKVFQLPYVPFPEGYPLTRPADQVATYATKYEPLRGYLHSSRLGWSYGAMKGRAGDWSVQLAGQPLAMVIASVAAAGFDGVWVDPAGFEPGKATRVRAALRSLLGVTPLISPDHDLWFYDLRPYVASLQAAHSATEVALLRERTLHPLTASCAANGLTLSNPTHRSVESILTVHLAPAGTLARRIAVAPGARTFALSGTVRYATLTDAGLAAFTPAARSGPGSVLVGLTGPPCPRR